MNIKSFTFPRYITVIFLVLALPVLYAISRYNYLLFHSLVDGLSIVIAACVFVIIWNSRHLIDNDYFLYVGISFLFWAFLDFMHLLGNKNMGVFPAYGNLGPAFYIAGRYLLSISLIIATLFINRKLNATLMFAAYSIITLLILLSIFYWQIFPVCIIDGAGLTPFKVISDYIICFILLGSIGVMIIKSRSFDSRVLWLIVSSIILSIATGLSFTLYTDPFGIMNLVGHMFQIVSFYLIYLALIETSLTKPQDILYRKLKQNEEALAKSIQQLDQANAELKQEIAERRQAEEELRESEYRLARAEKVAKIGNWKLMLDTKEFTGSLGAKSIYGLQADTISLDAVRKYALPEYIDIMNKKLTDLITEDAPYSLDIKICRPTDGKIIDIHSIAEYDKKNNIVYGVLQDITDRMQAETQKAELEAQNRQLQKSESLGRMAGAIAHHFNNQLGVVIGNLELAMDKMPQDEEPFNTLNSAMQSAWKAARMSGMMLTYVGQKSGQHEPLDISETCLRSLPILRAVMQGNVVMETDIPSPGPIVSANENQIQQVLTNLVTNAWESVGDRKGTISLNVKTVTPEEITAVHRYPGNWQPKDNVYACLEVTDTCCGIEDKDIEKLFDPFYSTKFTGRGMGLAVVLGIVTAHGGVISVDSKPGMGSTFRVFLPVSADELPPKTDKALQPPPIEQGGTVLLVEDEEQLRNMAATMLKRLGFSVIEAKDGVEAVDVFRQHQSEIKFVLSDLTMPRMDGWETLTALRKLKPGIPVILASGYDKAHVMSGDHSELPQAFLGKPYRIKELGEVISQVFG